MTIVFDTTTPPCAHAPDVYHDEHLHSPPERDAVSDAEWDQLTATRAQAHRHCAGCPFLVECLYRAVVEVDVSGFVACTTEHDRNAIRAQLGIKVKQPAMTPFGAARLGSGPIDHDAVMAVRNAHPKDSCHDLAERLACSTSTVKRHLRREREMKLEEAVARAVAPELPSVEAVLDCFDELESSQVA